ncbi:caldesmon-like [Montipora capricornis]|uniref:caldesmon-like n=2 Tax=Montipora TaxID=46703 RepID=UPI0035F1DB3E
MANDPENSNLDLSPVSPELSVSSSSSAGLAKIAPGSSSGPGLSLESIRLLLDSGSLNDQTAASSLPAAMPLATTSFSLPGPSLQVASSIAQLQASPDARNLRYDDEMRRRRRPDARAAHVSVCDFVVHVSSTTKFVRESGSGENAHLASSLHMATSCLAEESEKTSTNKYFQWTTDHDVIMCREVLVSEPYKFKLRTPERGQAWESVAQQLNSIHQPIFRVTTRSVRDRFSLLSTKYAHKLRMEEKASGIEVEQSELEKLIEEILEREKNAKNELESKDREKKSKAEKEKASAEEVRKQAMERMAKRKGDDEENKEKKPKIRRSTADAIDYLREKSSNEREYRKEELEIRKREIQLQAEKQDQTQRQQQAMFSAMMAQIQQQQQQQQNMMSLMKTLMENHKKA